MQNVLYKLPINRKMNKILLLLSFFIVFCIISTQPNCVYFSYEMCKEQVVCYADEHSELEKGLQAEIENQTGDLDFSEIDEYVSQIDSEILGSTSFKELVQKILNGEESFSIDTFFQFFKEGFVSSFKKLLPMLIIIFVIAFIYNFYSRTSNNEGTSKVIYLICFVSIALSVVTLCKDCLDVTNSVTQNLQKQINLIFPILLTLMCAVGGTITAGIYKPIVAILSTLVSNVVSNILLPIVLYTLVFSVISRMSDEIKLDKFIALLRSVFKWILGVCCSLYLTFLSVKAITSSQVDGISIKATKYAIKNYIPYLGGFISEGFEVIRAGSTLIKNSVGVGSLLLLFATILSPLLMAISLNLILKLASGLCQPLSDGKISGFLDDVSKSIGMIIACLLCVAVMYFVTILLIIGTANYVF